MFVTKIVGHGSFISLSILLIQMLVKMNRFDFEFESIESIISFIFGYGIW
jgi:hypothetical protein